MCPQPLEERDLRRDAVKKLIATKNVRSQEELAERLVKLGFEITQSSLSRDLRDLKAAKLEGRYVLPEGLMRMSGGRPDETDAALAAAAPFIKQIRAAGPHLLVVLTTPGGASPAGLAVDRAGRPEVVGTVAGDDTLFIATSGRAAQVKFVTRLREALASARKENEGG
jgi:transcriptional regulator of arginine metabolism